MNKKEKDLIKKVSDIITDFENLDTAEILKADNTIAGYDTIIKNVDSDPLSIIGSEIGNWKILKLLGVGGMSIVYLVERNDDQINKQAALKILPNTIASKNMIDRFLRERQILSDLNHNNIAQLYDAGISDNDIPWFVMELVHGENILSYAESQKLNTNQRIGLFKQVCDALVYAHSRGVIHRDIKPNNLLVNEHGVLKLLDFGIAADEEKQSLTMTGAIIGTPGYMSPEQAKGLNQEMDKRTDVFSLGVLLYKLLKKDLPFKADSISEISYKIIHDEPSMMGNNIAPDLQAITFKCLEKNKENRYQSVEKLSSDLDAFLNGDLVSAQKVTLYGRLSKKIKKNPVISLIITIAILATLFGIGNGVYQTYETFKRVQIAEKHLSRAQEIKAKVRRTHMMPFHNVKDKYKSILSEIELLESDIKSSGSDATGLSNFALGVAYLAMDKKELASENFKQAQSKGWQSPQLSSGLGLTLIYEWNNARVEARNIENKDERKIFLEKQRKEVYEPAIKHLKIASQGLSTSNYLAAYLNYIERDYDKAIESIEKEMQINPWHFEAFRLANTIYTQKYYFLLRSQSHNQSKHFLKMAAEALDMALIIGRSAPINYEESCILKASMIQSQSFDNPNEINKTFNEGLTICQRALMLLPDPTPVTINGSIQQLYRFKAQQLIDKNKNSEASVLLNKAKDTLKQLIMDYSGHEMNYVEMVATLKTLTDLKINNNESPEDLYRQAQTYLERVKKINPEYPDSWYEEANIQSSIGDYYVQENRLDKAIEFYNLAIQNADISLKMGIEIENMAIIAIAFAKLAKVSVLNNKMDQGIGMYKKSMAKFEELFKLVNDEFSYYEKYLSIIFDYFYLLKSENKDTTELMNTAKQTFNYLCGADFTEKYHSIELSQIVQKHITAKIIVKDDVKPCL